MIETILGTILAIAIAVERLTEIIKPLYLKAKNFFTKKTDTDLIKEEKIAMSIVVGVALSIVASLLGVKEVSPFEGLSPIVQAAVVGLFASFGSNVIHPIIGLVAAFKDAAEGLKKPNTFTSGYVTMGPEQTINWDNGKKPE